METKVAIVEALLVVLCGFAAWRTRGTKICLPISAGFGLLLGMCLHVVGFGVLGIEGPGGERDLGLLVGFGIIAGVMIGIPAGLGIGALLYRLKPRS